MDTVRISGREYPARAPFVDRTGERLKRAGEIVQALRFAASSCSEVERRLYMDILRALAHAENWRELQAAERLPEPSLADALAHGLE